MFTFFKGASLQIAKNLIKVTGVKESLALFEQNNLSNVGKEELLTQILALNSCNLLQTMKEDFINNEINPEDRQDVVDDYVVENLRNQSWVILKDGADLMDKCQEILGISEKFLVHWESVEDPTGPGPRFHCVKELLRKLGNEMNQELHDALLISHLNNINTLDFIFKFFWNLLKQRILNQSVPDGPSILHSEI